MKNSQSGFSIISVLVLVAVVAIIAVSTTRVMNFQITAKRRGQASGTRADLMRSLSNVASYNASIILSASSDATLNACVFGGTPGSCPTGTTQYFDLRDGFVGSQNLGVVAGKDTTPIFYDLYGNVCAGATNTCVFQAVASYDAYCVAPCSQATYIDFHVTVSKINDPSRVIATDLQMSGDANATATVSKKIPIGPSGGGHQVNALPFMSPARVYAESSIWQSPSTNQPVMIGQAGYPANTFVTGSMNTAARLHLNSYLTIENPAAQFNAPILFVGTAMHTLSGPVWAGDVLAQRDIYSMGAFKSFLGYYYLSDGRMKKDVTPIADAEAKVSSLTGYSFDWKKDGKHDLGFIAQNVEKIFPELVKNESGFKSVEYGNLISPILEAQKATSKRQLEKAKKLDSDLLALEDLEMDIENSFSGNQKVRTGTHGK